MYGTETCNISVSKKKTEAISPERCTVAGKWYGNSNMLLQQKNLNNDNRELDSCTYHLAKEAQYLSKNKRYEFSILWGNGNQFETYISTKKAP